LIKILNLNNLKLNILLFHGPIAIHRVTAWLLPFALLAAPFEIRRKECIQFGTQRGEIMVQFSALGPAGHVLQCGQ
jgi:hypothetical protein